MTTSIHLTGLTATNPMAALAAWGVVDLLTAADGVSRLWWCGGPTNWHAVLDTDAAEDLTTLARVLHGLLQTAGADGLASIAGDLNKMMPEDFRGAFTGGSHDSTTQHLLSALACEYPLRPDGQVAMTPLAITSFQGRRSFFAAVQKADSSTTVDHLLRVLTGPWVYAKNVATLNLDPAARQQDSARLGVDASSDRTRGVPGTLSLAARGLTLIPPLPSRGARPNAPWIVDRAFVWPVWTAPLSRRGIAAVLGRRWALVPKRGDEIRRNPATLHHSLGCSIAAVYCSSITDAKDGRRLAHARVVP